MEGLLTPVSTSYNPSKDGLIETLVEVPKSSKVQERLVRTATTPEGALEILRNQPDFDTLTVLLSYIEEESSSGSDFNIRSPSPVAAQLVNVLVAEIIPSYWTILRGRAQHEQQFPSRDSGREAERLQLLACLRSVTGLNAILIRLRALLQQRKEDQKQVAGSKSLEELKDMVEVIQDLLEDDIISKVSHDLQNANPGKSTALWQEFSALLGGGKILSVVAETEASIQELSQRLENPFWAASGSLYCTWLGQSIARWVANMPLEDSLPWKRCSILLSRSFRLGYTSKFIFAPPF
jgi:telomere length regulation protein